LQPTNMHDIYTEGNYTVSMYKQLLIRGKIHAPCG